VGPARQLHAWRDSAGLTVRAAAVALGCSPSTVSALERGVYGPSRGLAARIKRACGIEPEAWPIGRTPQS